MGQQQEYKPKGFKVKPRSRAAVRELAHGFADVVREVMSIKSPVFPVVQVVDYLDFREVFELDVVEAHELEDGAAAAIVPRSGARPLLRIHNDVYERAADGGHFERFTLAHELGHFLMHMDERPRYARGAHCNHRPFQDSEWQANAFAGELLVDSRIASQQGLSTEFELMRVFGVSSKTAAIQLKEIRT